MTTPSEQFQIFDNVLYVKEGVLTHVDRHISLQVVRDAIAAECNRLRAEYETKLAEMGVTLEAKP